MTLDTIYPLVISNWPKGHHVYDQGASNKCQSCVVSQDHDIRHVRAATAKRACLDQVYWDAKGGQPGNLGATYWDLQRSLRQRGISTADWVAPDFDTPPPASVYKDAQDSMPVELEPIPYIRSGPFRDNAVETLRMLLAKGYNICVVLAAQPTAPYWLTDWRDATWTHDPNDYRGEHAVLIVGCDHAARKFEAVNSYGPNFGAGGRFAIGYDQVVMGPQYCVSQLFYFKTLNAPLVSNAMPNPIPTALESNQLGKFYARIRAQLFDAFTSDADKNGLPDEWAGALALAGKLRLSDKLFELLAGLPRFTVIGCVNDGTFAAPAGMEFEDEA